MNFKKEHLKEARQAITKYAGAYCQKYRKDVLHMTVQEFSDLMNVNRVSITSFENGRTKFLVADEAGLGKTYIARGVIEKIYSTKNHSTPFIVYYFGSNAYLLDNTLKKLTNENTDYNIISGIDRLGLVSATLTENSLESNCIKLNCINLFGFSANLLNGGGSENEMNSYGEYYLNNIKKKIKISDEIQSIFNDWEDNIAISQDRIRTVREKFRGDSNRLQPLKAYKGAS